MTCPKCHSELETEGDVCPECGIRLLRNVSGVMKTSVVMIAARGEQGFYHSVHEVPEPLRTQLLETTGSRNAGTIVIADRAGKEKLTQAMSRRESTRKTTREARHDANHAKQSDAQLQELPAGRRNHRFQWIAWAGLALVLMAAAAVAALFYLR
jgi:hypothetical protein